MTFEASGGGELWFQVPITGTTFVFNAEGQPSMAGAYPVSEEQR